MLRLGVLVHPTRPLDRPLAAIRAWAAEHGATMVQVDGGTDAPSIAPPSPVGDCGLVIAIGGDGTVLSALREAAPAGVPVLGVSCGSLGALTTVSADDLAAALDGFAAGTLEVRRLPALAVTGERGEVVVRAVNDVVLVRRGTAQLTVDVTVGTERFAHVAGDGVIVATALGSSAYSMAAGGPLLYGETAGYVCTPLSMHGGNAPSLVIPAGVPLRLQAYPGYGGFDLEVDGRRLEPPGTAFTVRLDAGFATLVGLTGHERMLTGLRRRGLVVDSPRTVARDRREGTPFDDDGQVGTGV